MPEKLPECCQKIETLWLGEIEEWRKAWQKLDEESSEYRRATKSLGKKLLTLRKEYKSIKQKYENLKNK